MKTVIITGASGLLGQYLCQHFANEYKVIGLYHTSVPTMQKNLELIQINLLDANKVMELVTSIKPDFIIHTAGYTSVDECELNPEIAHDQNVVCTRNICCAINPEITKLMLISTDHLFSGDRKYYIESDKTEPLNIYAITKLNAEKEVLAINNALIVRTNFYGGKTSKKLSFSSWIIGELRNNRQINMFDDVYFTPISICGLAENIELLINTSLCGIYNVVGNERMSKYDFAILLASVFGLSTDLINKTTIKNIQLKAKRPNDMSLSIQKISHDLKSFRKESVVMGLQKIKSLNLI